MVSFFWYILLQGYLLSTSIFYLSKEFSFWFVFKYTIFHGFFEILAIILVGAFALKPAVVTFKCIILKKPFFQKRDFKDMSILFVLYVFFLFLAALIEGLIQQGFEMGTYMKKIWLIWNNRTRLTINKIVYQDESVIIVSSSYFTSVIWNLIYNQPYIW